MILISRDLVKVSAELFGRRGSTAVTSQYLSKGEPFLFPRLQPIVLVSSHPPALSRESLLCHKDTVLVSESSTVQVTTEACKQEILIESLFVLIF